jgi:hypothetical protein
MGKRLLERGWRLYIVARGTNNTRALGSGVDMDHEATDGGANWVVLIHSFFVELAASAEQLRAPGDCFVTNSW